MKAWLLDALSGIDSLRLAEVADPVPGRGEVTLAVKFASLNPADRYLAEGRYPAKPMFPHTLGRDGIGEVIAVGEGAASDLIGQTRLILRGETGVNRPGTFAQRVGVSIDSIVPVPAGWTQQEAACAPLVYLTAYQALTQFGEIPKSAVVLVTGASGGVGVASVQLAHAMGYTVVALSRSADKQQQLRNMGADIALDPNDSQWTKKLRTSLPDRKVDLAIDNIGGTLFPAVIESLGEQGRVSIVGRLAGPVPEFNTASLIFRRIKIGGVSVGAYGASAGRRAWDTLVEILKSTGARPIIDRIYEFDELPRAFEHMKQGPMGKVLIKI